MPDISLTPVTDPQALAQRWRALEAVSDGGFFRGWSWLGALLPYFAAPHLLAVSQDGQDMALGLFDRRRGRLILHETGDPAWDQLYVEHNGLLLRPGAAPVLPAALEAALAYGPLVLSGVDPIHLDAAAAIGHVERRFTHQAPVIDLAALPPDYLDSLSANTRAQIRRALRLCGDAAIEAAATLAQAEDFFGQMVALHQAAWQARNQPGAFASAAIRDFHAGLIARAFPRGEVALLRVTASGRVLGVLYQFQHGGRVLNYQSGFAPDPDPRMKTGLVCHTLAIGHARSEEARLYDLLGGAQRYKTSLAPAMRETLHWIIVRRHGSLGAAVERLKATLR
jgi:CelD/BcsL family acetyltransferase involved in cellulose biosynthesis